jgi:hypothetical protein
MTVLMDGGGGGKKHDWIKEGGDEGVTHEDGAVQ